VHKEFEDQYHRLEAHHWWFRGRREIVHDLVVREQPDCNCNILEIGCSAGLLIRALQHRGYARVSGIDISSDAIALCRKEGLDARQMDAQKLSFADESFDLLTASDVLEHLPDEAQALQEWRRVLKPDGILILFVPAFQFLWSAHDVVNKHYRRYRRYRLLRLLQANGLVVRRSSYWNVSLFLPITMIRLMRRTLPQKQETGGNGDLFKPPELANRLLTVLLQLENQCLRRGLNFPFGVSVMAVARKPKRN
jgi:SAM-dependent methyltransferase